MRVIVLVFVVATAWSFTDAQLWNGFLANQCYWDAYRAAGSCVARAFRTQYLAMNRADCFCCDKYFHCLGNYNAVYECDGDRDLLKALAKLMSDCRESTTDDTDDAEDQVANLYGREGNDCAARYLCSVNCMYDPTTRTCDRVNCGLPPRNGSEPRLPCLN